MTVVPFDAWDFELDVTPDAPAQTFLRHLRKNGDSRTRAFLHKTNPLKKDDEGRKGVFNKSEIESWQLEGRGVYVVIGNGGDSDAEITSIPACFAEWDDRPPEEQLNHDWSTFIKPTMVVATVRSAHNYWRFKEDVTDMQWWRWMQTRLNTILKADSTIQNPSRVMRLPGCYYADGNGDLIKEITIHHISDHAYTVDEFEAAIEREEKRLGITPGAKPQAPQPQQRKDAGGFRTASFHQYMKRSNARTKAEVISALKLWPPRQPNNNTYRGEKPVRNTKGELVHIDYFQTLVGCWKAFEYAGVEFDEAVSLMEEQHPEWAGLRQNLAGSGGCGANGKPIEDDTFWKTAIEKLGWEPEGGFVAQDEFTCSASQAAETIKQNRITASEELELVSVLPSNLALPLKERADTFPVHESAMFAPVCSAFAAVVGIRLQVQVKKGHKEPFVFWFSIVQQISAMKSPVGKEGAYLPLGELNARDARRYAEEREARELQLAAGNLAKKSLSRIQEMKLLDPKAYEQLMKDAASHKLTRNMRTLIKNYFQDPQCPILPPRSLTTKDATLEKIAELLALKSNHGVLLYFDELARFMETMDQYRGSGGDRQAYLDLWSGSSIDVMRVGKGHVYAPVTALNLMGYIQPEKLHELLGTEMFTAIHGGDGFWVRWLFCTPPHIPDHYNTLEGDISELMAECLTKVDRYLNEHGNSLLKLSPEALQRYVQQYNAWVDEAAEKSLGFQGMSGKMKGYLARFAGLLHVIEWARGDASFMSDEISLETLERAISVCTFFRKQYEMVMSQAGTTGLPQWINRLELKVSSAGLTQVTTSNMTRWRIAEDANDANNKICMLVDELGLGNKKKNRQGNWVWRPHEENPNAAKLME